MPAAVMQPYIVRVSLLVSSLTVWRLLQHALCPAAQKGTTALIWASICGHESVVKVLLEAGADKEAKNEVRVSGLCLVQLLK